MAREGGSHAVARGASESGSVVACVPSPQHRARVVDALRTRADVRFVDTFLELRALVRRTVADIDTIIVSAHDGTGAAADAVVRAIVDERPRTAIIAYCQAGAHHNADLRELALAGVHQFVFAGIDDTGVAFRAVLASARRHCAADCVMRELGPVVPASLHRLVEAVLARPDELTSIAALADAVGVHRKTLFNHCQRAGFLQPAELLAWCRLAIVAHYLETTGCTIESIAIDMGYASDTALRNTMKRYTGLRASEVRARGGVACIVSALVEHTQPARRPPGLHIV